MFELNKILYIDEGKSLFNVPLNNGDDYDSFAELKINNVSVWSSNVVNCRATKGYRGGKLAHGEYWGRVGYRANGLRVIKLFSIDVKPETVHLDADVPEKAWRLPSSIPNPNHGGQFYVEFVQIHGGGGKYTGEGWNWSHCCITILNASGDYTRLMKLLNDGDIIKVVLR